MALAKITVAYAGDQGLSCYKSRATLQRTEKIDLFSTPTAPFTAISKDLMKDSELSLLNVISNLSTVLDCSLGIADLSKIVR